MRRHLPVLATLAALVMGACSEQTQDRIDPVAAELEPVDAPVRTGSGPPLPPVDGPAGPLAAGAERIAEAGGGLRRFQCEGGHMVVLAGPDLARVTLADGRVIELPRQTGGGAEYRGVALSFDPDDDGTGGVLAQDEVGGFACEPAD